MATLATYFRRPTAIATGDADPQPWIEEIDPYALRPLPCEDVYFYCKKINNSRIVRQADPVETRRAFRVMGSFFLLLFFAVGMLAPRGLGLGAGYRLEALKTEHSRLMDEQTALELEEARLMSPQRMAELAQTLKLEDPTPGQVHLLNPKPGNSVAWNLHGKRR